MELGAASRFSLAAKRSGSSWVESLKIKRPRFAAELNHPPLNLTTTQRIMENGELGVQLGMTVVEFNRRSQVFSLAAEWKSSPRSSWQPFTQTLRISVYPLNERGDGATHGLLVEWASPRGVVRNICPPNHPHLH